MTGFNPPVGNTTDAYKVGHKFMLPPKITFLESNWTARGSRIPGVDRVVFFGLQAFLRKFFDDYIENNFFGLPLDQAIGRHRQRVQGLLGIEDFNDEHWVDLHRLGYLPLKVCALPEGTEVPIRVPMFTISNTHPKFAWLVNYFESIISAECWLPITSATLATRFRRMLDRWAERTSSNPDFVDWQGHDFSFRGMPGLEAAAASGAGHLLSFAGSDTICAMDWANEYYGDPGKVKWVGGSVYATEHSIMCAGLKEHELATFQRLLQTFPEGIISIVSDTWNLWSVITEILPKLKNLILARRPTATAPGKLVIRPDSGNPVNIICGDPAAPAGSPANLGVVKLLWNEFGGTLNAKGFNELDHHIGVIYGDAITYERADEICQRLEADKFASTNVVFGIGSFTYQYVTRDTFSMAMKATAAVVDGQQLVLYKDPITDNGIKKSGRGRLAVLRDKNGELIRIDEATDAQIEHSLLRPIWSNGIPLIEDSYLEIAKRLGLRKILPEG